MLYHYVGAVVKENNFIHRVLIQIEEELIYMPHIFSVEIHDYLSMQIRLAEEGINLVEPREKKSRQYYEGTLFELVEMRQYLTEHIDLKTQKYY